MAFNFTVIFQKLDEIDTHLQTNWTGDESLYDKLILIKLLCENRLNSPYANLVAQNDISQIQNNLTNLENYVKLYKAGQPTQITNINSAIASIMQIISRIPFVGEGETSIVLTKIINDFTQKNAAIIAETTQVKNDLSSEIDELKEKHDNLLSEISTKKDELIKQFSSAQKERNIAFTADTKKHEDEFKDNEDARREEFKAQIDTFATHAKEMLTELEVTKKKVQEIYGLVGELTVAGSQQHYADKAESMANRLQFLTVLIMGFAIYMVLHLFGGSLETISLSQFLYKFSIGAIILLPAIYLANEAKKQREKENRYRELEIKMKAISPYFNEIGDGKTNDNASLSEKDRVKLILAQKLLSPSTMASDNNAVVSPDIKELAKILAEIVSTLKK